MGIYRNEKVDVITNETKERLYHQLLHSQKIKDQFDDSSKSQINKNFKNTVKKTYWMNI